MSPEMVRNHHFCFKMMAKFLGSIGSGCTCKVLQRPNKNITILKCNMATIQCRKCKEAEETAGPVLFDNLATQSLEIGEERVGRRTLHKWFQGSLKAWDFKVCEDFE